MGKPVTWRPMTDLEVRASRALRGCSYVPGTFPKRFARGLRMEEQLITDGQSRLLWDLAWTFRRQITDAEVSRVAKAVHEGATAPLPQAVLFQALKPEAVPNNPPG